MAPTLRQKKKKIYDAVSKARPRAFKASAGGDRAASIPTTPANDGASRTSDGVVVGIADKKKKIRGSLIRQALEALKASATAGPAASIRTSAKFVHCEAAVVGKLTITFVEKHTIDYADVGICGMPIPSDIHRIRKMKSDAFFILLVQEDTVFLMLSQNDFWNKFPCIIVLVEGRPSAAARLFFQKLKMDLMLPVLALIDADPLSLMHAHLTTPGFLWLGLRPSDLDKFAIPDHPRLPMTKKDREIVKTLLKEDYVKTNPNWVYELNLMLKTKHKTWIDALRLCGSDEYLTKVYLPMKLQDKDWL